MREIGGYIELDTYNGKMFHEDAAALNCGRHCLTYLIRSMKIKRIFLPEFVCDSVISACRRECVQIRFYPVNRQLRPVISRQAHGEWVYVINYYGQLGSQEIEKIREKYENLIVDNTHAYFQMPVKGTHTLYSCRKYFGVPDGAFLYSAVPLKETLKESVSFKHMQFLLGRYEKSAPEFYGEYRENNERFEHEPLMLMSRLTKNLLSAVDYEGVKEKRTANFIYLHERLRDINRMELVPYDGAFMYPLYIRNGEIFRKILAEKRIYIPLLWPDVFRRCRKGSVAYDMAQNILPLPIDQRYGFKEMEYLYETVSALLKYGMD